MANLNSKKNLRESGIVFGILFSLIFILLPLIIKGSFSKISAYIAGTTFLVSIAFPYALQKPLKYWIKFGNLASKVNSAFILFVFFYLIIVPFSILRRIIKLFKIKKSNKRDSFYDNVSKKQISNLKDQY